jgi:hypothetical protein
MYSPQVFFSRVGRNRLTRIREKFSSFQRLAENQDVSYAIDFKSDYSPQLSRKFGSTQSISFEVRLNQLPLFSHPDAPRSRYFSLQRNQSQTCFNLRRREFARTPSRQNKFACRDWASQFSLARVATPDVAGELNIARSSSASALECKPSRAQVLRKRCRIKSA